MLVVYSNSLSVAEKTYPLHCPLPVSHMPTCYSETWLKFTNETNKPLQESVRHLYECQPNPCTHFDIGLGLIYIRIYTVSNFLETFFIIAATTYDRQCICLLYGKRRLFEKHLSQQGVRSHRLLESTNGFRCCLLYMKKQVPISGLNFHSFTHVQCRIKL